jgi:hypothetical protein
MFRRKRTDTDLPELIPTPKYGHEITDEGKVVVIIPKFQRPPFNRLMRRMKAPNIRVKLDEIGSFIWLQCDGQRNLAAIMAALHDEFGERVEPVDQRVGLFIRQLLRGGMVRLEKPAASPES